VGGAEVGGKGKPSLASCAVSSCGHGSAFGDLNSYLGFVQDRIGRGRRYPELAIRLGLEGVVEVRVRVNPDGSLAGPPVISSSSGHDILDQEALRMVARAAPFPALPGGVVRATDLTVPVRFHLEE
jgi:protein TonB